MTERPTFRIRAASDEDSIAIKQLVFAVLKEFGLPPDEESTDRDLNQLQTHYQNNGGYFGVVVIDDKIIATVGLYRIDDYTCELRKMYVLSPYRRLGLGRQLLDFALNTAVGLGFRRVVLETTSPLTAAIQLYKKYGFKEFKPPHLSNRCDRAFELNLPIDGENPTGELPIR